MTDHPEIDDGVFDVTDIPTVLHLLALIDSLEYEAKMDIEEAAHWRRQVFETESEDEADALLREFTKEMAAEGNVRVTQDGHAALPYLANLFFPEDEDP